MNKSNNNNIGNNNTITKKNEYNLKDLKKQININSIVNISNINNKNIKVSNNSSKSFCKDIKLNNKYNSILLYNNSLQTKKFLLKDNTNNINSFSYKNNNFFLNDSLYSKDIHNILNKNAKILNNFHIDYNYSYKNVANRLLNDILNDSISNFNNLSKLNNKSSNKDFSYNISNNFYRNINSFQHDKINNNKEDENNKFMYNIKEVRKQVMSNNNFHNKNINTYNNLVLNNIKLNFNKFKSIKEKAKILIINYLNSYEYFQFALSNTELKNILIIYLLNSCREIIDNFNSVYIGYLACIKGSLFIIKTKDCKGKKFISYLKIHCRIISDNLVNNLVSIGYLSKYYSDIISHTNLFTFEVFEKNKNLNFWVIREYTSVSK